MNYQDLPFINKVTSNRQEFGDKVIEIANQLGIMPHWLMIVMNNESGLNSSIKNPYSSATGLIQFMADTAINLGTSTAALAAMSNVEQLDYVKAYFKKYGYYKKIKDVADTYLAVFFPLALYKGDDYVFPDWATKANPVFDVDHNGKLTKAEFKKYVNNKYAAYLPTEDVEQFEAKKKSKKITTVVVVVIMIAAIVGGYFYFSKKK